MLHLLLHYPKLQRGKAWVAAARGGHVALMGLLERFPSVQRDLNALAPNAAAGTCRWQKLVCVFRDRERSQTSLTPRTYDSYTKNKHINLHSFNHLLYSRAAPQRRRLVDSRSYSTI